MRISQNLGWLAFLLLPLVAAPVQAAKLSPNLITLIPGESATIKVSKIKGTPTLSNTDSAVATATLVGSKIQIAAQTIGSSTLAISDSSGTSTAKVTVQPPMSLSATTVSLGKKQSATVTVSNAIGKVRLSNSKGKTVKARLSGNTVTLTGQSAGSATLTLRDKKSTRTITVEVSSSSQPPAPPISGNTNGRLLASNCFQCHGTYGSGGFESLIHKQDLADELNEYLSGGEDEDDIMGAHLKGYTPEQLQAIVDYLANP